MYSIPFQVTDWNKLTPTLHPGEQGHATWRTWEQNGLRIRMVEYSKDYRADHWCEKGHLLFVLDGEIITELQNGSIFRMSKGMSYHVSDGKSKHKSVTLTGAKLLIVDGNFLKTQE